MRRSGGVGGAGSHAQNHRRRLGESYELSGGSIKSAVFRAAVEASLMPEPSERIITMAALQAAAREELDKDGDSRRPAVMYT